ncbi:ecdysone-induced protein 75B isoform X1 [Musca domestica]|uniref:Ecdysone-induced protein 75B isoform X1 n=1 Tax=Musca domestica TaxID=7370 RepID=A0ABM3V2Z3_MUSDO|nr:ecdysone-induced protein 75B isoform X1 [Musca domestica]
MVCAMQELTTSAVAITEHHHHHHHHHLHAAPSQLSTQTYPQLQHQGPQQLEVVRSLGNGQFLATTASGQAVIAGPPSQQQQQQQQQSQVNGGQQMTTTIVVLATAALANNQQQQAGNGQQQLPQQYQIQIPQQQQQHQLPQPVPQQKLTTNKSQQLKKQHASLVRLLESAPITKKVMGGGGGAQQQAAKMTQNTSPVVQANSMLPMQYQQQQQQQHIVIPQQQQQQPQQIIYVEQKPQQQQLQQHQTLAQQLAQPKRLKQQQNSTTSNNTSSSSAASGAVVVMANNNNNSPLLNSLQQQQQLVVLPALNTTTTTPAPCDNNNTHLKTTTTNVYHNNNFSTTQEQPQQQSHEGSPKPHPGEEHRLEVAEEEKGASKTKTEANVYEPQQCPWKKIRYARELKQKEQQQQQHKDNAHPVRGESNERCRGEEEKASKKAETEEQICDKLAQNDKDKSPNNNTNNTSQTSASVSAPHHSNKELNLAEQTHKEIAILLKQQQQNYQQQLQHQQQQQRRDSSDSNSSMISNTSSTHSLSIGCTCTPQQLSQQQRDSSSDDDGAQMEDYLMAGGEEDCNCPNCCGMDMDSGCDDEVKKEEDLTTLNYLCQKFDENLETTGKQQTSASASNQPTNTNTTTTTTTDDQQQNDAIFNRNNNSNNNETAARSNEEGGEPEQNVEQQQRNEKGFFRRSIQQKIQYRPCTKNQQCSILRINRNRCQYCRLKKCIAVGMSRDAVRFGRVPKREKARILAAMQQSTQNRGQQRALASELDDQPRLLSAVLRAHLDTCEFTKEKVAAMRQRARECPSYSMPTLLACPLNPAPELQSEQEFSQRFAHVIRGVIDFAGMIPGFQLLSQDDKFTLLKAGLFDALFVRLICMFDNSINSIICLNGQVMRRDAIQNGANARFLVDSTFNFAERMNSMNLTDAEIGLFCAIVLITPDRPGLRNIELIERMYNRLKGCLQTIINQNRPDQPDFMSKLLETMPDLRTLSTLHTEKLVVFRTEHKELLRQQMWSMEEDQQVLSKSPNGWDDHRMDVEAKSPLGSVSSTESGDLEYQISSTTTSSSGGVVSAPHHLSHHGSQQTSSLASSAPLLAATLSGTCPLRNRANSGSSGDSTNELDIVGSHAHLTQNGLTITPIVRAHSHQQLHHHLTSAPAQHRYRKLDSPTDSGIESGNEKTECGGKTVSSGGSSSCSSPRSSVDDALDCSENSAAAAAAAAAAAVASSTQVTVSVSPVRSPQPMSAAATSTSNSSTSPSTMGASGATLKRQIVDDMPVLKRVLQAPPLYDTNSLMDEAYKPHKKFRALRHREFEGAEADATSSTNPATSSSSSSSSIPAAASSPQLAAGNQSPPPAASNSTNSAGQSQVLIVPQATHSPQPTSFVAASSPPAIAAQHQSQLHMHLTRPTPTNSNSGAHHQQQQPSSLSSTHSVLAKSLMAEPRMTPEQMKRSDIIQNYIMRESSSTNLMACSPHGPGSRSPAPGAVHGLHALYGASNSPSSSPNSNCNSPSTTTVTALASPPVNGAGRWAGHSVITTTTINQRQQSVSPSSNGSSSSSTSSSASSSSASSSSAGCQYFQSPHSTSASVSPPRPSPSAMNTPPRLLELQVDIADSQQPLNLSKKSPTPPPSKLQALVAAATAAQRYPTVSADVTVTASSGGAVATAAVAAAASSSAAAHQQVQKVMLEA